MPLLPLIYFLSCFYHDVTCLAILRLRSVLFLTLNCGMTQNRSRPDLADELLHLILDHVAADPQKSLTVDKRAYLSQESFQAPPHPPQDQAETIGNFRLACRRFSGIGARQQFGRVTTRFSWRGFKRLEGISEQAHLAKHVKKFSYMIPCFYTEGTF